MEHGLDTNCLDSINLLYEELGAIVLNIYSKLHKPLNLILAPRQRNTLQYFELNLTCMVTKIGLKLQSYTNASISICMKIENLFSRDSIMRAEDDQHSNSLSKFR